MNSPPKYRKTAKKSEKDVATATQSDIPDLADLERRIEQLAQELERAHVHRTCNKCGTAMTEEPDSIILPPSNRPTPSQKKISVYTRIAVIHAANLRLVGI